MPALWHDTLLHVLTHHRTNDLLNLLTRKEPNSWQSPNCQIYECLDKLKCHIRPLEFVKVLV